MLRDPFGSKATVGMTSTSRRKRSGSHFRPTSLPCSWSADPFKATIGGPTESGFAECWHGRCTGLIFDVENNDLWWPTWGERPVTAEARAAVLRDVVSEAPRLVPLVSHRYLPCEPNESGNPVFSIYQSDAIYYGVDLIDYFEREFGNKTGPVVGPVKPIRFWSELVSRNND